MVFSTGTIHMAPVELSSSITIQYNTYPLLQEHIKLPRVLVQACSHGDQSHVVSKIEVVWPRVE